jgi:sulfite reductase (NADPH) hemoprotein beta-component
MRGFFRPPPYERLADINVTQGQPVEFQAWYRYNTRPHKVPGYRAVVVSLKAHGEAPGDMTADQMDAVADLADRVSSGEVRTTHDQNLVLGEVRQIDLIETWQGLKALNLATPNIGTLTDMICCPGLDFCSLANAGSIGIAKQIQERFSDFDYLYDLGHIEIKMSGCMNACGHHHVGNIGILGVDKHGEEWYQITLGGSASTHSALGEVIGPSVAKDVVAETIEHILDVYVARREEGEEFLQTVRRIGVEPFAEKVYGKAN